MPKCMQASAGPDQNLFKFQILLNADNFNNFQTLKHELCTLCAWLKERVHSEMKISLFEKGILVTVPIRFISFRLFWLAGRESYGSNNAGPESENAGPGSENAGPGSENAGPEVKMQDRKQ